MYTAICKKSNIMKESSELNEISSKSKVAYLVRPKYASTSEKGENPTTYGV